MSPEQLRAEIEDLLRTLPGSNDFYERSDIANEWIGRAKAVIREWHSPRALGIDTHVMETSDGRTPTMRRGVGGLVSLLQEARHSLRLRSLTPTAIVVPPLSPFTYFDELRKLLETATSDVLFVDPYLDSNFVSRYLPHVKHGVQIRLLARKNVAALVAAVDMFSKQYGTTIGVRSAAKDLHDRFVFIDRRTAYQSGASFKDGAANASTTLTEMVDAFTAIASIYEQLWSAAKAEN
jgi:hypothetical protein